MARGPTYGGLPTTAAHPRRPSPSGAKRSGNASSQWRAEGLTSGGKRRSHQASIAPRMASGSGSLLPAKPRSSRQAPTSASPRCTDRLRASAAPSPPPEASHSPRRARWTASGSMSTPERGWRPICRLQASLSWRSGPTHPRRTASSSSTRMAPRRKAPAPQAGSQTEAD